MIFTSKQSSLFPLIILAVSTHTIASDIEEIIIETGLDTGNVLKIPKSIYALDSSSLTQSGSLHLESLIATLPGVRTTSGGARARFMQIRGVGDLEQFADPKGYPSVGVQIDGIDLDGTFNGVMLTTKSNIEVHRGPSGTGFGASASGGLVSITSQTPTTPLEGSLLIGAGNYGMRTLANEISGEIFDGLSARLSYSRMESDGYIDNKTLDKEDTANLDESALNGKLFYRLGEDQELTLSYLHMNLQNGYDHWNVNNTRDTLSDQPGSDDYKLSGLSLTHKVNLAPDSSWSTLLSWTDIQHDYDFDADWATPSIAFWSGREEYLRDKNIVTADTRLQLGANQDTSGIVGLYFQKKDDLLNRPLLVIDSDFGVNRYALYGKVTRLLGESLSWSASSRVERVESDFDDSLGSDISLSETIWLGNLSLSKFYGDKGLAYLNISSGEKPEGINAQAISEATTLTNPVYIDLLGQHQLYDRERLISYELGIKNAFWENTLAIQAAIFYTQRDNAQLENWVVDNGGFTWIGYIDATGNVDAVGVELDASLQFANVRYFMRASYLESTVEDLAIYDLDADSVVDKSGRRTAMSPSFSYSIGADISVTDDLLVGLSLHGTSDAYFGYYHDAKLDDYYLLNGYVRYSIGDFDFHIWGRNLLDEDYAVHGLYFGNNPAKGYINEPYYQYGEPRIMGISGVYNF